MPVLAALLAVLAQSFQHSGTAYSGTWMVPSPDPITGARGDTLGFSADGCGFSGVEGDILLPCLNLYLPVPWGSEPLLSVEASGVFPVGGSGVSRALPLSGPDAFERVASSSLPVEWGVLDGVTTFRGFSLARIRLHPVISMDGGLVSARAIHLRLSHGPSVAPEHVDGVEGELLLLITGTDLGWHRESGGVRLDSPFAGLPWARIGIDTAGIYAVPGSRLPDACGFPSSTLSLFTGRGRMMGASPWDSTYSPLPVPMLVGDGGDGIFDEADSIYFFARGLSWWNPDGDSLPGHFMHQFSGRNFYWLTWGGEPGSRMPVFDAGPSGAAPAPDRFLARLHFEKDLTRKPDFVPGEWVWDSALGSGTQWFYHDFGIPGSTTGFGTLRIYLKSSDYGTHRVTATVNGTVAADTSWSSAGEFVLEVSTESLQDGDNVLGLGMTHNPSSDDVFMDWFEVFPELDPTTHDGQTQVPLEWLPGGRFRFDWDGGLAGASIFCAGDDTESALLEGWSGSSFEVEPPSGWHAWELWIVPPGGSMTPPSIEYAEPGGLVGLPGGAERLYIHPAGWEEDVAALLDPAALNATVCLQDIYDEFNGGVRDPYAICAFLDFVLDNWDPVPVDVILCGSGHYDPRNRLGSRASLIDPIHTQGDLFQDDLYAMTRGAEIPQFAVSRIATQERAGFSLIAARSASYRSGAFAGSWLTRVIGAADDERSSKSSYDETYHTESMERILETDLPCMLRPVKHYLIFYGFDDMFKKPEARADFLDLWSEGALLVYYLGHGGYDQLADEGLLYMEDMGLLQNSMRLPVAFFGSCRVGQFQDPARDCLAQAVTTAPLGGAIAAVGATFDTSGPLNEILLSAFTDALLSGSGASLSSCLLAAKVASGYTSTNHRVYAMFGDGSTRLALPGLLNRLDADTLSTGEQAGCSGEASGPGTVMVEAFESCRQQTYYTFRQFLPIDYLDMGACLYSGSAGADPGFSLEMFVPVDADTGSHGRVSALLLSSGMCSADASYPLLVVPGDPSASDSTGPEIELWIEGFRNVPVPTVSGDIRVEARLSDSSGINLLGNPGRQLVLYVDGSPSDVSDSFSYDPGSSTEGGLRVELGTLSGGAHILELGASDCLLNRSSVETGFQVVESGGVSFWDVFAYPCPASDGVSINWSQSGSDPVDLDIYTISGRRLESERNLQSLPGYNQYWWDCEDRDGDPVASGSYIFRISAGDSEACGVLALVR